jgi:predicted O-methyltransferase YrrM
MTSRSLGVAGLVLMLMAAVSATAAPAGQAGEALDRKVQSFLDKHAGEWRDMNVPETDGRILYDLVIKNKYTRALEIGTSTGHSGIWIAWALSKTGGKLITVDIDEGRYREALANFREAGLDAFIDARLADAHELVQELPGPFDFVFIDAEKRDYLKYLKAIEPKLKTGAVVVADNVIVYADPMQDFLKYIQTSPKYDTVIIRASMEKSDGMSVSCKVR